MAESDDAEFAQLFELIASSGEIGADIMRVDARMGEGAERLRGWLATQLELSDEEVERLSTYAEFFADSARVNLRLMAEQAAEIAPIMDAIDPETPEHVGVLSAQVDGLEALVVKARATLAFLETSYEIRRRVGPDQERSK
jgi:hypothetical protein